MPSEAQTSGGRFRCGAVFTEFADCIDAGMAGEGAKAGIHAAERLERAERPLAFILDGEGSYAKLAGERRQITNGVGL